MFFLTFLHKKRLFTKIFNFLHWQICLNDLYLMYLLVVLLLTFQGYKHSFFYARSYLITYYFITIFYYCQIFFWVYFLFFWIYYCNSNIFMLLLQYKLRRVMIHKKHRSTSPVPFTFYGFYLLPLPLLSSHLQTKYNIMPAITDAIILLRRAIDTPPNCYQFRIGNPYIIPYFSSFLYFFLQIPFCMLYLILQFIF